MLKKLQLLTVLLAISLASFAQDWIQVDSELANGLGVGQISIGMNDATAIWAAAINADGSINDSFTKSTDGGLTWISGTFNAGTGLSQLFAIDATTCWALFNTGASQGIYKTVDGGATWVKKGGVFNASSFADVLHFFNDNDGYAMGDPVGGYYEIYTTTDGGETWTRVPQANIPAPTSGEYGITGNVSSVGNNTWFGTNQGRVFRSTDKGYTWQATLTPFGNAETVSASFRDANVGICFRSYLNMGIEPILNVTVDGGATWSSLSVNGSMYARWFAFIPGTASTWVGSSSEVGFEGISLTENDGVDWSDLTIGTPIQAPAFVNNSTGYAGTWVVGGVGGMLVYNGDPLPGGGPTSLIMEDFESYTAGQKLVQQAVAQGKDYWTTWSNTPGSAEDPLVSADQHVSGANSVVITGTNDAVMLFGDKIAGKYSVKFNVYVPSGNFGYYNILHLFNGANSEWGTQVYFDAGGLATVDGGAVGSGVFNYNYDEWFEMDNVIDLNNDWAQVYFNGTLVVEWQWSLGTFGTAGLNQLGAMDIYAWDGGVGGTPMAFFDDISYTELAPPGGDPEIIVSPLSLTQTLESGQTATQNLSITNTGIADLDYMISISYVTASNNSNGGGASRSASPEMELKSETIINPDDFAVETTNSGQLSPESGDDVVLLHYDGDNASAVGLTNGGTYEVAAMFPATMLGSYIGMELTKVEVYINDPADSYKLKIYGSNTPNAPGSLLSEQTFAATSLSWNTITLTSPVTVSGGDIWVAYEIVQSAVGVYPAGTDAGPHQFNGDWIKTGASWAQLHIANPALDYNWNIRATLEGNPISAWLSANPASGTVIPGGTDYVTMTFNAGSLDPGTYLAHITIASNDPVTPSVVVPITLNVGGNPPSALAELTFEDQADWSLTFDPWSVNDVDQQSTYGFTGITFPNAYSPMAYIAFNPATTEPPMTSDPEIQPHSGARFGACMASTAAPWNNDWMISPQIQLGSNSLLNLWVKSYTSDYGLERYKIGVSTTGISPSDFTIISGASYLEAPVAWTEKTFDLSAYDGQLVYVAIQCISQDAFVFMLDDIMITSVTSINENDLNAGIKVYPNPASNFVNITSETGITNIKIINYTGQVVYQQNVSDNNVKISTSDLPAGIYVLQMETQKGWASQKLVVK